MIGRYLPEKALRFTLGGLHLHQEIRLDFSLNPVSETKDQETRRKTRMLQSGENIGARK
jgi:hypothetical protein